MEDAGFEAGRDPVAPPLIEGRDLLLIGASAVLLPLAWALPPRSWPAICGAAARLLSPVFRMRRGDIAARMEKIAGANGRGLHARWVAARLEAELQYLREYRPGGWQPRLRVAGRRHLEAAVAGRRGAILWVAPVIFAPLLVKRGLAEAGLAVAHLSREFHGPSDSRFGRRWINPVSLGSEDCYLRARFAMQAGHESRALRGLVADLRRGGLVSITCAQVGRRLASLPLLGGQLAVATGAASLALTSGAPLLPVWLQRTGPTSFDIIIEPPLTAPRDGDRDARMLALLRGYGRWLDRCLSARPEAFADWRYLRGSANLT